LPESNESDNGYPKTIVVGTTPTRIINLSGNLDFGNVTAGQSATRTLTAFDAATRR
jgi:hypothetical protein